jgi:hypothetical protein
MCLQVAGDSIREDCERNYKVQGYIVEGSAAEVLHRRPSYRKTQTGSLKTETLTLTSVARKHSYAGN